MNLFWEKGYDSVGIAELETATGLNRSSLYNTFGSKDALFALALERYSQTLGASLLAGLVVGKAGLSDIKRFLDQLAAHLKS
jgi:TetR/AcrR family transcriptional repressor of nem operon